jgi:hypothetical protein
LSGDWKACRTVTDRLYAETLDLCPVTRTKNHAKQEP